MENNSLKFNIADLLSDESSTLKFEFTNAEIILDQETHALVSGEVRFILVGESIMAEFNFEAIVRLACVRCLEDYQEKIIATFEQEYLPEIAKGQTEETPYLSKKKNRSGHHQDKIKSAKIPLGAESPALDEGFTYSQNNNIMDVSEAIRQELLIRLPIKPLCKKTCLGLCPICGANLNQASNHKHN